MNLVSEPLDMNYEILLDAFLHQSRNVVELLAPVENLSLEEEEGVEVSLMVNQFFRVY